MLIAYIHGIEYSVCEKTESGVEIFSFIPVDGFIKQSSNVYTRFVAYTELDELYDVTYYCMFQNQQHRVIGKDTYFYYLTLEVTPEVVIKVSIKDVLKVCTVKKNINIKQRIIS